MAFFASLFRADPFRGPLLARSGLSRVGLACALALCLWLAILWAVSLP